MKVNGIFKKPDWKPMSKADFKKFLAIENILKTNLRKYNLTKDKYPIVENG